MHNTLVSVLGLITIVLSLSLDIQPPYSHEKNTWYIEDLRISRIVNPTGGVNATFSIYRSYFSKCIPKGYPMSNDLVCGWIIADTPLLCFPSNYQSTNALDTRNPPEDIWYTCHERLKAVDGERILSDDEKQWVKWRSFGLEEADVSRLNSTELNYGPVR